MHNRAIARIFAALAVLVLLNVVADNRASAQGAATANDVARVLAGLPPSAQSPLSWITKDPGWQQHARTMNASWATLEKRQLHAIHAWRANELKDPQQTLFYFFSGPDFLYADAFFPDASTYVLSGLEVLGPIPGIAEPGRRSLAGPLSQLRASLNPVLSYSFFRTREMRHTLGANSFTGTLPILYIFLARSGKTLEEVTLHDIDENGAIVPVGEGRPKGAAQAAKIAFKGDDGKPRTLYYVRTDLSDGGLKRSGFLEFCRKFGQGDGLVKSASYLLHSGNFSQARDFLLANSARIVQDNSGIPVSNFKPDTWRLRPYGNYLGPISLFPNYQSKLAELFRKSKPPRIDFGIGYRYRPAEFEPACRRQGEGETDAIGGSHCRDLARFGGTQ